MSVSCVTGLLWGDEGKGKIIDLLAAEADFVVRYGGGHNAGHTLVVGGERVVLHLVPCGVRHPGVVNVVGNGVVVDPFHFVDELEGLARRGFEVELGRDLLLSERCHLILPLHQRLDQLAESLRAEGKIGTTGRGIGPAYADRANRTGLRLGDLLRPAQLEARLTALLQQKNPILESFGAEPVEFASLRDRLLDVGERLGSGIVDAGRVLRQAVAAGRRILLEGAQGVLLDVDHGTYPYVTSSSAAPGGIAAGTGLAPDRIHTLGVVKAYATRVGEGPFPTELAGALAERLREAGREFGSTTGRPRRCGWFDTVAARYAIEVSGATELVMTNLDVLSGFDPLPVCVAYQMDDGVVTEHFPAFDLEHATPVYESVPGFTGDLTGVRSFDDLPAKARSYVTTIEERVGRRVSVISVGPGRDQVIRR
ncbi:MAG: adenylosuccinate synthase [Planctomycetes bacterium]|nr:adenylosuccinate synthase [Planctomycetota bacterium]MCB9889137.1 adenylosuccinate synthase [Planctomycetota bacterium]